MNTEQAKGMIAPRSALVSLCLTGVTSKSIAMSYLQECEREVAYRITYHSKLYYQTNLPQHGWQLTKAASTGLPVPYIFRQLGQSQSLPS